MFVSQPSALLAQVEITSVRHLHLNDCFSASVKSQPLLTCARTRSGLNESALNLKPINVSLGKLAAFYSSVAYAII